MENYLPWIVSGLLSVYIFWRERVHDRKDVEHSKMMKAKSLAEFNYFDREYAGDIKDTRSYNKDIKKERLKQILTDFPEDTKLKKALDQFSEDWGEDEVDHDVLKEQFDDLQKPELVNEEDELARDREDSN